MSLYKSDNYIPRPNDIQRSFASTESEYSAKKSNNRYPFIANAEAVGASATGTLISGIGNNERVAITTLYLSHLMTSAVVADVATSIQITDTSGNQISILCKLSQASTDGSDQISLSFPMPIIVESGREVRVINSAGVGHTGTAILTGWIETF